MKVRGRNCVATAATDAAAAAAEVFGITGSEGTKQRVGAASQIQQRVARKRTRSVRRRLGRPPTRGRVGMGRPWRKRLGRLGWERRLYPCLMDLIKIMNWIALEIEL